MINILVIEDDNTTREKMTEALKSNIPSKVLSISAEESEIFETLSKIFPKVILMDIQNRRNDGLHLLKIIHKKYPKLTIIANSMLDTLEYRLAATQRGASYFFSKKDNELSDIISTVHTISKE
jgi:DNA-binding NarL/FixJ family response regulator